MIFIFDEVGNPTEPPEATVCLSSLCLLTIASLNNDLKEILSLPGGSYHTLLE
jgi:hypothetical protein